MDLAHSADSSPRKNAGVRHDIKNRFFVLENRRVSIPAAPIISAFAAGEPQKNPASFDFSRFPCYHTASFLPEQ
jgi:hypothetical protein